MPRPVQTAPKRAIRRKVRRRPDPREQQKWFKRLPEHAKREMRVRWSAQEGHSQMARRRRNWVYQRFILESAGLMALAQVVFSTPQGALVGALYGTLGGIAAARLRAGTYAYAFIGAITYGIYSGTTSWGHLLGFVFYVGMCAMLGLVHVLQRCDGTES